jgi:hypothetical protein
MPHDLFGDVVARRPTRTRFRRVLTVTSILLHAIVISTIVVVQVFAIGPLPLPHRPLIFEELRFVKLIEIPLPPAAPRGATSDPSPTVSRTAAPTIMPTSIIEETGLENVPTPPPVGVPSVVGVRDINSIGTGVVGNIAPPPPVKPMRVHAGMQAPVKVVSVDPIYPAMARSVHVEAS